MISILIPVFNTNVVELVVSIQRQLALVKEKVEIVVMDDASNDDLTRQQNREGLAALPYLQYVELPVNCGRNIIRHKLAASAKFDRLVFLDADSNFCDSKWLQNYIAAFTGNEVIMGGRRYHDHLMHKSSIHMRYGTQREQLPAVQRNKHPYRSFMACNFLISKQQLSQLVVDNNLKGYCHEDTFMGLQFEKLGLRVIHIDNPVFHEGIDEDSVFIDKQQEALYNLRYLYNRYRTQYNFSAIKLIRIHQRIVSSPAGDAFLNLLAKKKENYLQFALRSHKLLWLDLWKLVSWHSLNKTR